MIGFIHSAWVIARRDFVATVWSRTFLFFLLGPLLIIGMSFLFGSMSERMARQDVHARIAVVAAEADFQALADARARLDPAFGERRLPDLVREAPGEDRARQVRTILASRGKRILAVLTGTLDQPTLTGAISGEGGVSRQVGLILDEARQQRALAAAGRPAPPAPLRIVEVDRSEGALAATRAITARAGQLMLFMLTVLLAGMLLSNLLEEKSNKIIEVLAAALPIDAIFIGKLGSMLAVSLVGIAVWVGGALVGLAFVPSQGGGLPAPAVGWPLFVLFVLLYYAANYLLLGALFLGIGSQASSVREVQTLSMPVTVGQMLIFLFASFAVGAFNSPLGIAAAVFPFSSPLTMVARAAQTPELWPHALALAWQALWVWLTVSLGARLFRRNVLKSGGGSRGMLRRKRRV
ncbi:MAG: type transport system permease protein [Sphingomonadales bacterium]|jgi:ABC-2 type transport system permease protein|nr:type transport system permease protein [Sphingomonadales bacterium]